MPNNSISKINANLLQMINNNLEASGENLGRYGLNENNEVVFNQRSVSEGDYIRLIVHLSEQGIDGERLLERRMKTSEVQSHLQKLANKEKREKASGNGDKGTLNGLPAVGNAGKGMEDRKPQTPYESKGARPKIALQKRAHIIPPPRTSPLPDPVSTARPKRVLVQLSCEEREALQDQRKNYHETLAALRKKEQEAKEIFSRIAKVKGSSKKQDNMAMTFAATRGAVNVNSWLNSSDGDLFSKASACVTVYAQERPKILNAVKDFCPAGKNPGELAGKLLSGVREGLESQMYEPGNRRRNRVDNTDKDAIVEKFSPALRSTKKEEGLREKFQFAKRQRRADFEAYIWKCCVFNQNGKLDAGGTVSQMRKAVPVGSLSEPMIKKLRDWIYLVERKKNAPYGVRFFELKQGILKNMGVYDLSRLISKMTREEFKIFQSVYEEKIAAGALGKISKSVLVESIVNEEMKKIPAGPKSSKGASDHYKEQMRVVRISLENYARAVLEKAMTTLSDTPHIPDDLMYDQAVAYELVRGKKHDSWGLKHRFEGTWFKWNRNSKTFEVCSRDESEKSYASNKHLLSCFDDELFAPWDAPVSTTEDQKAGAGNNPKEELKAWDPIPADKIMLNNEDGLAFHEVKGMIDEKQNALEKALKEVKAYCEKATNELSALAGLIFTEGNTAITDLSDENRPLKLGEKFGELDGNVKEDLTDALESVISKGNSEKIANDMLRYCYEAVCDLVEEEKRGLSDALSMTTHAGLQEERYRELRRDLKSLKNFSIDAKTELIAEQLMDTVCNKLEKSEYNPIGVVDLPEPDMDKDTWAATPEAEKWLEKFNNKEHQSVMIAKVYTRRFLKKACMLLYKMRSHEPPMSLRWKTEGEVLDKRDCELWRAREKKLRPGAKIDFVVWPACYLYEDEGAPMVSKGTLKPK
ncbi:hypothetical protein [Endozoicomonas atrinae]|uniref:hypothetical protein n=1 Tax=Endozoicomonas atrinae TaxID=1333660 RepID=UPI000826C7F8|nr:hypothetical protein [Endozoicomonas atrinae]